MNLRGRTQCRSWHQRHRSAGFSLLELVLALVVCATVLLVMLSTVRVAFTARSSAMNAIEQSRAAVAISEMLRTDLEAALPPDGDIATLFVGTDDNLAGVEADTLLLHTGSGISEVPMETIDASASDDAFADLGLGTARTSLASFDDLGFTLDQPIAADVHSVEYALVSDTQQLDTIDTADANRNLNNTPDAGTATSEGHMLVRRVRKDMLAEVETEPSEQVIARGIRSMNVRYFDGTDWLDSWDSTTQSGALPTAIELVIQFTRATQPSLVQVIRLPMAEAQKAGETRVIR